MPGTARCLSVGQTVRRKVQRLTPCHLESSRHFSVSKRWFRLIVWPTFSCTRMVSLRRAAHERRDSDSTDSHNISAPVPKTRLALQTSGIYCYPNCIDFNSPRRRTMTRLASSWHGVRLVLRCCWTKLKVTYRSQL